MIRSPRFRMKPSIFSVEESEFHHRGRRPVAIAARLGWDLRPRLEGHCAAEGTHLSASAGDGTEGLEGGTPWRWFFLRFFLEFRKNKNGNMMGI
jgi:hypothetical protein